MRRYQVAAAILWDGSRVLITRRREDDHQGGRWKFPGGKRLTSALLARVRAGEGKNEVRWVEVFGQSLQLHITPLVPAELFRKQMADHPRAWIFTSATLAMGEDFSHFKRELGIEEAASHSWPSPFDYPGQALLYTPRGLPADPKDPRYTDAVVEAALPVLEASRGRALLLFTSHRALRRAHELLRERISYPLLVQGTGSRSELLVRFRQLIATTEGEHENIWVPGSHLGLGFNAAVMCSLADRLAQPEGNWQPWRLDGRMGSLYETCANLVTRTA